MQPGSIVMFKKFPFVRLLLALVAGILLQWYGNIPLIAISTVLIVAATLCIVYGLLPAYKRFALQWLRGVCMLIIFVAAGAFITWHANITNNALLFTKSYCKSTVLVCTVNEPLTVKAKTYKTVLHVTAVKNGNVVTPAEGYIITYIKKDSTPALHYGAQIAFSKAVQPVANSGNPGAFNYRQYLLFQGVTSQVYLQPNDYVVLPGNNASMLQRFLQSVQNSVITSLQQYISGRNEQGVAEALLIGYRGDLDKTLVQSYSNTGVVHIIAISGMHLGIIYAVLLWCFKPLKKRRWYRYTVPIIVLAVLWLFTLVAGAVPSISRSAVMFTFIIGGTFLQRKTNIYNTLAASAFCLLVYNPFYLWDVGFQLSYAAVLSIVMFVKPIYHRAHFANKFIDKTWLLIATNLAAQVFTVPLVLYYFHQFPVLFLVTNLVIIPLSFFVLFALLSIVLFSKISVVAVILGKTAGGMLWLMNWLIQYIELLPVARISNIKFDMPQQLLAYLFIALIVLWLLLKRTRLLVYALSALLTITVYTSFDVFACRRQNKLFVYNINGHTAIDVVRGGYCNTLCDSLLTADNTAQNFTLVPAHVQYRSTQAAYTILPVGNSVIKYGSTNILLLRKSFDTAVNNASTKAGIIVLSGKTSVSIQAVCAATGAAILVADNTVPLQKIEQLKKECDSLHLRFHSTAQDGAFIMDL